MNGCRPVDIEFDSCNKQSHENQDDDTQEDYLKLVWPPLPILQCCRACGCPNVLPEWWCAVRVTTQRYCMLI